MLVRVGFDVVIFLCLEIQLEFLQQLKLPRNAAEGDCPITMRNFSFPRS